VYARVLIVQGDADAAVTLLERLLSAADADGRCGDAISILPMLALAHQEQFELDRAVSALDRALQLAQGEPYQRVFVDEGAAMTRLLKVAQRGGISTTVTQQLLVALGEAETLPPRTYHDDLIEPITAREMEVLRLIAMGLSNNEIAEELFISLATVKRHVTNLYGKLGVSSRTEALRKARDLELLVRRRTPSADDSGDFNA
jgi:DNA-binding CsgD family transcriptional regulator